MNWEILQNEVVKIIKNYIKANNASILSHVPNITVGFDDAELVNVKTCK